MGTNIMRYNIPEIFNIAGDEDVEFLCDEIFNVKRMIKISLEEGELHGTRGLISKKPSKIIEEIIDIQDSNNYLGNDYIKYIAVDLPMPDEYDDSGLTKEYKDNLNKFIDRFLDLFENYSVVYMLPCGCSYIHFLINPVDFGGNELEFSEEFADEMKRHTEGIISDLYSDKTVESITIFG